ncbi:Uncharacterized protein PCOAH_00029760 [Plasmodium coatneyi]|uniref:CTLH domain-containing protein n=1 Tax=Plasmodium coatneyi TaxID=208452 RepID=A0A1B1E0N6_9APIC|nr:Uncharacterized protein PCOAH_00029760 [Plasmodium coatneyi]ANQ08596.1 Uncharacterized protein PCOAH_00029760 [Plasmodium coatneyi]
MNVTSIINREKRKRQEETSHVIKKKFKNWNMLNSLEGNTQNGIASTSFRTKKVHTSECTQEGVANISSNNFAKYDDPIILDKATSSGMCAYPQNGSAHSPVCNNPDLSWAHPNESQFHLDVAVGGGEEVYRQDEKREKQSWENGVGVNGVNKLKRIRGKKSTKGDIKANEKKKRENRVGGRDSDHSGISGGRGDDGFRNRGHTSSWSSQSRCYCSPSSSSCSSSCCDNGSSDFSEGHSSHGSYGSLSRASNRGRNHKRRKDSEGNNKPSRGDSLWEGLLKKDVILLLIQAIKNMGYKKSAKHLELESGIELEQPIVKEMHKNVLAGKWKNAVRNLKNIGVNKKITKAISFLLYEQCFIEYLYEGKHFAALRCLRNKLAKFCFDEDTYNRLHECTTFFMSLNNAHLIRKRKQNYQTKVKNSRKLLFEKINRLLPEHVILPPRRLAILLHQSLKYQVDNCLFHNNFSEVKLIRALLQGKKGREELHTINEANVTNGVNVTDATDSADPNGKAQKMARVKPTTAYSAACQAKTFEFKKQKKSDVSNQVDNSSNSSLHKRKNTKQEDEMTFCVNDFSRYHDNVTGECSMHYQKANPKSGPADFGGSDDAGADKGIPCEVSSNETTLNERLLNETLMNDPPPDKPDNYTTTLLWDDELEGENQFNVTSGQPVRKSTKLKCGQLPRGAVAVHLAPGGKVHTSPTRESTSKRTSNSADASANVNVATADTLFTNPFPCLKESIMKSAKSTACRKYAKITSSGGPKICTLKGSASEQRKGEVTVGKNPNELIVGKNKMQQGSRISGGKNVINPNDGFVNAQEKGFLIGHHGGNVTDGGTGKGGSAPLEGCVGDDYDNVRPEGKDDESDVREAREEGRRQFTRQDRTHSGIYEEDGRRTFTLSLLKNHQCKKIKLPYYCIKILQGHKDEVWYVNVSKNGKYIASASKDKSIILWKGLYPFNKLREWNGHLDGVSYVIWSHNSKYLVSGSNDSNIIIWSPKSNKKKLSLTMHNGPITSIYWSKDDSTIISSAFDKKIYCTKLNRELKGFSVLYVWSFSTRIQNFVFTNNEKYLIAVPSDKNVRVIDFAVKKELYILPEYDTITSVCASSLYNHILVNIADQRPTVKLWDVKHRYIIQTYRGHKQGRFIVHSTFGGKKEDYVISGSEDSLIYIWHKTKGFLLDVINGHASTVSIAIWPLASSKFPYMVSASDDHTIMVWNVHPKATTIRRDSRRRRKKFVHPFLRELTKFRPVVR